MRDFNEMTKEIIDSECAMLEASSILREAIFNIILTNTSRHINVTEEYFDEMENMFTTFFEKCKHIIIYKDEENIDNYYFVDSTKGIYETILSFTNFIVTHDVWYEDKIINDEDYIGFCYQSNGHDYKILCDYKNIM